MDKETPLKHNQRVVLGHGNAFWVQIPLKKDEAQDQNSLSGYEEIMKDRLNADTPLTNNIWRYLKELESRIGVEQVKKFVVLFEQGLDDLDEANTYTELR